MFRLLVCGCGNAGLSIASVVTADGRGKVVGLFDPVDAQRSRARERFPDALVGSDYERLLAETRPDAVVVAGPDHLHAEQAVAGLESGCHVLVEKPMATSTAGATRIIESAEEARRHVMVDHTLRFAYPYREMVLAAQSGDVGTIFFVQGDYIHDMWDYYSADGSRYTPWRVDPDNPQNILFGGGIHAVDLMLWTVGVPVAEVFCYANKMSAPEFPSYDCYILSLCFENGVLGKVFVSSGCAGHAWHRFGNRGMGGGRIAVYGTEGTLWRGKLFRRGQEPIRLDGTSSEAGPGGHAWDISTRVFLDLLEAKVENPITARAGARAVAACEAAMKSVRTNRPQRPRWFG